ncbi:MAG: hypothetical protein KAT25_08740 [Sulfuriflexus sp.]|nr:hypothetical protein [Sulfuriflexus sp.]
MIRKIILISSLCLSANAIADDFVWLVGGGSNLQNSQVQIEKNIIWAAQAIEKAPLENGKQRYLNIFFTDGNAASKDVIVGHSIDEAQSPQQLLAIIYASGDAASFETRNHQIQGVRGSTVRTELEPILSKDFSDLKQGDRGLFVFNGHGGLDKKDTANNTFRLWNNSSFKVNEFAGLLDKVDNSVPMRFVFTQCYSGGFERLVHPNAADSIDLVSAPRCGFFAEAADRKAEGCSSGVNTADYRDYSTYFFAALSGKTRQGEELPANPDRNKDGEVSLYEAHLYTLAQAHSTDLPRSTSEVYLERWQPWYLRWFFAGEGRGNVYAKLANDFARELRVPTDQSVQRSVISKKRRRLDRRSKKLGQERKNLQVAMTELRYNIRYELEQRWPKLAKKGSTKRQQLVNNEAAAIRKFIVGHEHWQRLLGGYKRVEKIINARLEIERDVTRFDKLRRLNKLARLRQQFDQHATSQQKAAYQQLLGCEKLPL